MTDITLVPELKSPRTPRVASLARRLSLPNNGAWSKTVESVSRITGARGRGWITIENDARDYELRPGFRIEVPAHARVVVTALGEMDFDFEAFAVSR